MTQKSGWSWGSFYYTTSKRWELGRRCFLENQKGVVLVKSWDSFRREKVEAKDGRMGDVVSHLPSCTVRWPNFSHIKFHEDRMADIYLPGNLHIQNQGMWEDACPFLKVGYVTVSSECVYIYIYIYIYILVFCYDFASWPICNCIYLLLCSHFLHIIKKHGVFIFPVAGLKSAPEEIRRMVWT